MHDLQKQVDQMSKMFAEERSKYHLTLGELATLLEITPKYYTVNVDRGGSIGRAISYRGYYDDLAFEPSGDIKLVKDFSIEVKNCLGKTFEGYKGGDFKMHEKTPLWLSFYGDTTSIAIMGMTVKDDFKTFMLFTKDIDLF